jgi:hypothetical protein
MSGKKTKKCHPELVGYTTREFIRRSRIIKKYDEYHDVFSRQPEYMPEPHPSTGWSRENFRNTGCPYGTCLQDPGDGSDCPAMCGVRSAESSLPGYFSDLVGLSSQDSRPVRNDYREHKDSIDRGNRIG